MKPLIVFLISSLPPFLVFANNNSNEPGDTIYLNIKLSQLKTVPSQIYGFHHGAADKYTVADINSFADSLRPRTLRFPSGGHVKFTHLLKYNTATGKWDTTKRRGYNMEEIEDFLYKAYKYNNGGISPSGLLLSDTLMPALADLSKTYDKDLLPDSSSYLMDFIRQVKVMTNYTLIRIVYCANVLTATPDENVQVVKRMLDSGLNVVAMELGNEIYSFSKTEYGQLWHYAPGISEKDKGKAAAKAYFDYVNGISNADYPLWLDSFAAAIHATDVSADGINDYKQLPDTADIVDGTIPPVPATAYHDYIGSFRMYAGPGTNKIKTKIKEIRIGICGAPASVNNYPMYDGTFISTNSFVEFYSGWDEQMGLLYDTTRVFLGVSKPIFDAYIVHPYFDQDFFKNAVRKLACPDSPALYPSSPYSGLTNNTDPDDPYLDTAFRAGRLEFANFIDRGFDTLWNYWKKSFKLKTAGNKKNIWFTEWNILGNGNFFKPGCNASSSYKFDSLGDNEYNSQLFYNTYLQASIVFNWLNKLMDKAADTSSKLEYATYQLLLGDQSFHLVSTPAATDSDTTTKKKRITYYSFLLARDALENSYKTIPLNRYIPPANPKTVAAFPAFVHMYAYASADKDSVCIYYDNASDSDHVVDLDLAGFTEDKLSFAGKYFDMYRLYSTNGHSPAINHNTYYSYSTPAPVGVTNLRTDYTLSAGNNYVTLKKYSQGYFVMSKSGMVNKQSQFVYVPAGAMIYGK